MTFVPTILEPGIDCAIFRRGSKLLRFDSGSDDPIMRSEALRGACDWANANMEWGPIALLIGAGEFDCGKDKPVVLPNGKTSGLGKEITIIKGATMIDPNATGLNFQLQNSVVEDLTLINDCWNKDEDGGCVGFLNGPFSATLRRCKLWCRDWTVFTWQGLIFNSLLIDDCDIYTGRVGIASESSGVGQNLTVRRSRIYGDASLSQSIGATSDQATGGVFGIVHRGGDLYVSDTEFQINCKESVSPSYTPRACGITDRGGAGGGSAGNTRVDLWQNRFRVAPNGADPKRCLDLDFTDSWIIDNLAEYGCRGSGWRGELSRGF